MKRAKISKEIEMPQGVSSSYTNKVFTAKGKAGEVSKKLYYPGVSIVIADGVVEVSATQVTQVKKMQMNTIIAHIKNILNGVNDGYTYKLKICSGHFPMTVTVSGDKLEVKNYLGEKVPRLLRLKKGAKVAVDGNFITVDGVDKELSGQIAADIEQLTRITNRDRRIFQDGIFIVEKPGKEL